MSVFVRTETVPETYLDRCMFLPLVSGHQILKNLLYHMSQFRLFPTLCATCSGEAGVDEARRVRHVHTFVV